MGIYISFIRMWTGVLLRIFCRGALFADLANSTVSIDRGEKKFRMLRTTNTDVPDILQIYLFSACAIFLDVILTSFLCIKTHNLMKTFNSLVLIRCALCLQIRKNVTYICMYLCMVKLFPDSTVL